MTREREPRPDIMLPRSGEIPVDVLARLFLDGRKFSIDPERTILDCLIELGNIIRRGDGTIRRAVVKSYWFPEEFRDGESKLSSLTKPELKED